MTSSSLRLRPLPTPAAAAGLLPSGGESHRRRRRAHRRAAALGLISALLSAGGSASAQQFSFRAVALTRQHAPGMPAGVNYSGFFYPTLNAAGQNAFPASVLGPDYLHDWGLWSGAPGSVKLLAFEGDPAPGTPAGVNYAGRARIRDNTFSGPTLNVAGQSTFGAELTGSGVTASNDRGLWVGAPGSLALLAREGNHAPGADAGVNYAALSSAALNAAGQSVFPATLTGPGVTSVNDMGIWSGTPGSVALLARTGNHAPGTPSGVNYSDFSYPTLNAMGQSAFFANITGPGVTSANDQGLWLGAPSSVALLAREGNHAPGAGAGVNYATFFSFNLARLNAAGQSAFGATLAGPGVTSANDQGLWLGAPGDVALVARTGNHAPGTPAGVNYAPFAPSYGGGFSAATLNAIGRVVFEAILTGPGVTGANDSGIWSGEPGSLAKVYREGDAAPGAGAGTVFGQVLYEIFAFNDRGEVVFLNELTGPGVTDENDGSLWFWDTTGNLSLIVREGDSFEMAPGDTQIIDFLQFSGGFNDLGQVSFVVEYFDFAAGRGGSGIFIATPVLQLTAAVSRKKHDGAGTFNINLPLSGAPGVECRSSGGNHTLRFTFNNNVVSGNASVTTGTGTVSGTPTFAGNNMMVNLTGVADVQKIAVTLNDVTDNFAQVLPDTAVSVNMLIGDATGNKSVNASDIGQTKAQSGAPVTNANFRYDVTVSGKINASDIGLVKSRSGASVP